MFSFDFLFTPAASGIWAGVGAVLVKALDWLHNRYVAKNAAQATLAEHVNAATKLLIDNLMAQINAQGQMMTALQEELRDTHRQLDDKIERVLQLEAEVILLRREMQANPGSGRRGPKPKVGDDGAQLDEKHK